MFWGVSQCDGASRSDVRTQRPFWEKVSFIEPEMHKYPTGSDTGPQRGQLIRTKVKQLHSKLTAQHNQSEPTHKKQRGLKYWLIRAVWDMRATQIPTTIQQQHKHGPPMRGPCWVWSNQHFLCRTAALSSHMEPSAAAKQRNVTKTEFNCVVQKLTKCAPSRTNGFHQSPNEWVRYMNKKCESLYLCVQCVWN